MSTSRAELVNATAKAHALLLEWEGRFTDPEMRMKRKQWEVLAGIDEEEAQVAELLQATRPPPRLIDRIFNRR